MFDPTPAAARALDTARRWATGQVQPEHVLQGLLLDDEARPWLLLSQAGVDPRALRVPVPAASDTVQLDAPAPSPALREVLARATELSRHLGEERSIASEHLLLAIVESDVALRQALEARGLDFARLQTAIAPEPGPPIPLPEPLRLDEAADVLHIARILDASSNRAREALRVLEDYCRFVLDDAFLTRALKELRHALAAALSALPPHWLLQGRNTQHDVGVGVSTPSELDRRSALDVVQAAWKRLQEALRSLEEYGKLHSGELGQRLEALRYRSYTLERSVLLGSSVRQSLEGARLCVLVTSSTCRHSLAGTVGEALAGGAHMIQLRDQDATDREVLQRARDLRRLTRKAGALFILNDRPDLARLCDADGVHLGQDDLPVHEARRIVGPDALIGVSTHNLAQLRQAILDGAAYVGMGPTFASATKDFTALAGLDYVHQALQETSLPAFAIGGVTLDNVSQIVAAGARRIAVSAAICQAADPRATAVALLRKLDPETHE